VVADFSLTIVLRIIRCGELMGDLVFGAETGYLLVNKVHFVVRDDGVGSAKRYTMFCQRKLDNLLSSNFGERYCSTHLVK